MVLCYNGKVFAYSSNEEVNKKLYLMYTEKAVKEGYAEYEAQLKALEKIRQNCNIDFWEVK